VKTPISFTLIQVVTANGDLAGYFFAPTAHSCTLRGVDFLTRFLERQQASESPQNTSMRHPIRIPGEPGGEKVLEYGAGLGAFVQAEAGVDIIMAWTRDA
jgi:hypothetical protein